MISTIAKQLNRFVSARESLRLANQVCDQTQNRVWNYTATKAAALAESGRFPEAVAVMQQTIKIAPPDQHALPGRILSKFELQQPWRREEQ